jgi:hypothetical protein
MRRQARCAVCNIELTCYPAVDALAQHSSRI